MKRWSRDIKFRKGWLSKVLDWLQRPFPMFFIGITFTLIFDAVRDTESNAYYYLSDGSEKPELIYLKIGNLGSSSVRLSEFLTDPQISLKKGTNLKIDTAYLIKSSRRALMEATEVYFQDDSDIKIRFGKEALEKGDYLLFAIGTSGPTSVSDWKVKSRVLGYKTGLRNYTYLFSNTDLRTVGGLFLISVIVLVGFRTIYLKLRKIEVFFRAWEILILGFILILALFYLYIYYVVVQHVR